MVSEKPVRVMCRTCKGTRNYVAPKGVKEPGAIPTATGQRKTVTSTSRASKPKEEGVAVIVEWQKKMQEKASSPRIEYSIKATLKEGDVIRHPTFGDGIVMKLHFPNKAEILFQDDVRTLLHSK
ncbi:MAG: hypothetical protein N2Z57_04480 [Oscillospiraceae bacterium]|nr:hypothetical protein [Oscillospiraceae bacterium]